MVSPDFINSIFDLVSKYGVVSWYPIGLMYGIFTYIYHKNQLNVGNYTIPMDGRGMEVIWVFPKIGVP